MAVEEPMNKERCSQGLVMSVKGNRTLWMFLGRATARTGRELGPAVGTFGALGWWLREGRRLKLYKCLAPAWQRELTQNGRGGGAGTLPWQKR